ncbi:MAG: hypothetical protein LC804_17365 [Acidobacteria bacterium]|nr:hypothetical protein [Acidobacteriota bacterium]
MARFLLFLLILALQFGIFEAAMRVWGSSEAAPSFQGLFIGDPAIGYRLKPGATVRFTTSEFDTGININRSGVRDDEEILPKAAGERRIVVLGDSLVLSVQVPFGPPGATPASDPGGGAAPVTRRPARAAVAKLRGPARSPYR